MTDGAGAADAIGDTGPVLHRLPQVSGGDCSLEGAGEAGHPPSAVVDSCQRVTQSRYPLLGWPWPATGAPPAPSPPCTTTWSGARSTAARCWAAPWPRPWRRCCMRRRRRWTARSRPWWSCPTTSTCPSSRPPTLAPQQLANQFKGSTSRVLRERFPWLKRRLPSLWSRAYFVGSAGTVSAATIRRYIEQQKGV